MDENLFIFRRAPCYRDPFLKTAHGWLACKRAHDAAEGLWRIHDNLYDLDSFIGKHPGGADWIKLTKGTDITELFESHHISDRAEKLAEKFFVRKAIAPRNIKLVFREDGFYKVLKKRVREKLPTLDRRPERISKIVADTLLALTLILAAFAARYESFSVGVAAAMSLTYLTNASHNFFHLKANWRMKYANLSTIGCKEWKISHVLSHHMYPNSIFDLDLAYFEPLLILLPKAEGKNFFQKYISVITLPIIFSIIYPNMLIKRCLSWYKANHREFFPSDLGLMAITPFIMFLFRGGSYIFCFAIYVFLYMVSSIFFGFIVVSAQHHDSSIRHDGDPIPQDLDWGLYQVQTIIECFEYNAGGEGLVHGVVQMMHFGSHFLHHLFPSLDHLILPQLEGIFYETCVEFGVPLKRKHWPQLVKGTCLQLSRTEPLKRE